MPLPQPSVIQALSRGLIVSCQAPVDSPLHQPVAIAAFAQAAVNQGAVGVRIDTPDHIIAVREQVKVPIIGLWKQQIPGYEVYITPQFHHAVAIAQAAADAGADLVGTTLYGYTAQTQHLSPPGFLLLTQLVEHLNIPAICEGGISSPQMARHALDLGAYAVVVGTAITGIDYQVKAYQQAVRG